MATVYQALGLDPATVIRDPLGRPMPIAVADADSSAAGVAFR